MWAAGAVEDLTQVTTYWIAYVAMNGPANKRSTRILTSEEVVDADTEQKARNAVRQGLRSQGFTKIRITRSKIIAKV
jgi:hypothetical protein